MYLTKYGSIFFSKKGIPLCFSLQAPSEPRLRILEKFFLPKTVQQIRNSIEKHDGIIELSLAFNLTKNKLKNAISSSYGLIVNHLFSPCEFGNRSVFLSMKTLVSFATNLFVTITVSFSCPSEKHSEGVFSIIL